MADKGVAVRVSGITRERMKLSTIVEQLDRWRAEGNGTPVSLEWVGGGEGSLGEVGLKR